MFLGYPSLTGIQNNKYSPEFINWLFQEIERENINNVVQLGLDNGYLSSLFVARNVFSPFKYLGVGKGDGLPALMKLETDNFLLVDGINRVEVVSRVAYFIMGNPKSILLVEEMQWGPLFYWPLLKPTDIMITENKANILQQPNSNFENWHVYIK